MSATALRRSTEPPETGGGAMVGLSEQAGRLSVEIAAVTGIVSDLSKLGRRQTERVGEAGKSVRRMQQTNVALAQAMEAARAASDGTRTTLHESAETIETSVRKTTGALKQLSEATIEISASLGGVAATIRHVREAGEAIQGIAREAQILAINAGVEASRAGEAGRGFAIIAAAVRRVADQTREVADQSEKRLAELAETLEKLVRSVRSNATLATEAVNDASSAGQTAETLRNLVSATDELTRGIEQMAMPTQSNIACCEQVRVAFDEIDSEFQQNAKQLSDATERSDAILRISEDMISSIAYSGLENVDSHIIKSCQEGAAELSRLLTEAVDRGELSLDDLFDEDYQSIPGSNPQQFMTRFVDFTDRTFPRVQEAILELDRRVAFCAAVDRNAFLPTHNAKCSKPQGSDPVWNNANCRNRRIFDDRSGSAAGRNRKPFLMQTYRRDMGGGNFALMKEVDAPITVKGRHWGGLRIGFAP